MPLISQNSSRCMEDFKHWELHKAVGRKKDWIRTNDGEGVI